MLKSYRDSRSFASGKEDPLLLLRPAGYGGRTILPKRGRPVPVSRATSIAGSCDAGMNALTFSALAEPNRLDIIELLRSGPLPVGEIADRLELRQPQASKHLRVLSDAGLVEVQPVANKRIYQLRPEPFREMNDWLDTFRRVWEERIDRLEDYLQELQRQDGNPGGGK